jgi:DNA primase
MPETTPKTRKTTRAEKISKPAVYEAPVTEASLTQDLAKIASEAAKPKKAGKPTTYNEHIALVICIRIAEGESLRQILKDDGMPAQSTVYEWLLRHAQFAEHYARAREEQADTLADEIIQIADEQPEIVVVTDKKTGAVIEHKLDGAFLQWQKNRIDARKWTAMKLKPKKYGDRLAMEGVEGGAPIVTEETSSGRILEMIKNLEMTKRAG